MNTRPRLLPSALAATSLAGLLLAAASAHAATIDYTAGPYTGTFSWTTASNWSPAQVPGVSDIARFNQSSYSIANAGSQANLTANSVSVGGLEFGSSSAAFKATYNGITLGSSGIMSSSSNTTLLQGGTITLASNQVWSNTGSGIVSIQGAVTSGVNTYGIEQTGTGAFALTNTGTYSGGYTLTSGHARVGNATALGTGALKLNGGILSTAGGTSITATNAVTVGGDAQLGFTGIIGLLTLSGPVTVNGNRTLAYVNNGAALTGAVTLNGNLTFDSAVSGTVSGNTLSGAIGGTGGVIKTGTGQINLTGVNTFTGNINVDAGTLSITNAAIADTASVWVDSDAIFNLNFTGTDTIAGLYLAGLAQTDGTYGAVGSGATFTSSFFTGNGILNVVVSAVPEPSTYALLGGLASLGLVVCRRRTVRR